MSDNKKILAVDFDYSSAHRFLALLPVLSKNNIQMKLICDDKSFLEKEKIFDGLLIKNITSYPSRNFLNILKIENPDLIIVLNMNLLKIRSLNRCCKFLGIPIILLEHGVTSVGGLTNSKRFDARKALKKRYIRILKGELISYFFSYISYFIYTKASLKSWFFLFLEVFLKLIGKDFNTEDWNYSAYCVYLESDKKKLLLQLKNSIDKNKIHVVGNYDLNLFNIDYESFNSYKKEFKSNSILYIDSDCVERTFYDNENTYLEYIVKIRNIVNENGFKLFIKLHPNALKKKIDNKLSNLNIINISNEQFIPTLKVSKYVIGEPSSINVIACLTGAPILTPVLKPFNKKRYGIIMEKYPNRYDFSDFNELDYILKFGKDKSKKVEISNWIDKFAGPLPPSEYPNRVFKVIKKVLNTKTV